MAKRQRLAMGLVVLFFLTGCFQNVASESQVPRMTKEDLKAMIGNPDLIILDVRVSGDWNKSDLKIKGAVREDPEKDIKSWAGKYPKNKTLVFY